MHFNLFLSLVAIYGCFVACNALEADLFSSIDAFHLEIDSSVVSAGVSHSCALESQSSTSLSGSVRCWGRNKQNQSNNKVGEFVQVSVGDFHSCAINSNHYVECWGRKYATPPHYQFLQISSGKYNVCGVLLNNKLFCWGENLYEQSIPPPGEFVQVSCGNHHCCAIQTDGHVKCWGNNFHGQVDPPVDVQFRQISSSWGSHSCGVTFDYSVICWGNTDTEHVDWITTVSKTKKAHQVSTGQGTLCVVFENGVEMECKGMVNAKVTSKTEFNLIQVSCGEQHVCLAVIDSSKLAIDSFTAHHSSKGLVCWGVDKLLIQHPSDFTSSWDYL